MATRLYLHPTAASEPKPNVKQSTTSITQWLVSTQGGGQDSASGIYPLEMDTTAGTSYYTVGSSLTEPGSTHYTWVKAWVSPALNAQTISGTFTFVADFAEGNNAQNMMPRIYIYVWKSDDSGIRGTLYANSNSATEADTSQATLQTFFNAVSLTSVSAQQGDRIVIEVMTYDNNTKTSAYNHLFNYNGAVGSNYESYIEFSANLSWYTPVLSQTLTQGLALAERSQKTLAKRPATEGLSLSESPRKNLLRRLGPSQFYALWDRLLWACDMETLRSSKARDATSSSTTNDGTITNLTLGGTTGRYGNATLWPDQNIARYITVDGSNQSSGKFCPSSGFTVAFWVTCAYGPDQYGYPAMKGTYQTNGWVVVLWNDSTAGLKGYSTVGATELIWPNGIAQDSNWHLYVLRYDPGAGKMYVSWDAGTPAEATVASLSWDTSYLLLGGTGTATDNHLGKMDDFMYFNRVLTDTEITSLYNSRLGLNLNDYTENKHFYGIKFTDTTSWGFLGNALSQICQQGLAMAENLVKRMKKAFQESTSLRTRAFPDERVFYSDMEVLRDFKLRNQDDDTYQWLLDNLTEHATNFFPNIVKDGSDFYIAYQGPDLDTYAIQYKNGEWTGPVYVGPTLVPGDGHGAPTMAMQSDGRLVTMFGSHDSDIKYYYVSANPYSIEGTWTRYDSPTSPDLVSYPYLTTNPGNGDLYLFYRYVNGPYYNWLILKNWTYLSSYIGNESYNNCIYLTDSCPRWRQLGNGHWTLWFSGVWYYETWGGRRNAYLFYFDTYDEHWYNVSGTDLGTILSQTSIQSNCLVYQHGSDYTYYASATFKSDGNPLVVTTRLGADSKYEYISTYWTGSAWSTPTIIASTGSTDYQWVIGALLGEGSNIRFLAWNTDKRIRVYEYNASTDTWSLQRVLLAPANAPRGVGWDNYGPRSSGSVAIIPEDDTTSPFSFTIATLEDSGNVSILEEYGPTDGTVSSVTSTSGGALGRAYAWTGTTGEKITVAHHSDLRWTDGGPMSVSVWVYPTNTTTGRIAQKSNGSSNGWYIDAVPSGDVVNITFYWYGASASPGSVTASNVRKNEWNHIVFTVGSTYARAYLNRTKVGEVSGSGVYLNTDTLYIGEASDSTKTWNGRIDELAIYRRELAQGDVDKLYFGRVIPRSITHALSITESILKRSSLKRWEQVSLVAEVWTRLLHQKLLSQSLTVTDSASKKVQARRSQGMALSERVSKVFGRRATQGLATSDALKKRMAKVILHGLAVSATASTSLIRLITQKLTQVLSATDTAKKRLAQTIAHALSLSDTLRKRPGKVIAHALVISETLKRGTVRRITHALVLTATARTMTSMLRRVSETLSLASTAAFRTAKRLTQALSVTASARTIVAMRRQVSETIATADRLVKRFGKRVGQGLSVTATAKTANAMLRRASETLTLADSLAKRVAMKVAHALTLTETCVRNLIPGGELIAKTLIQGLSLVAQTARTFRRAVRESLSINTSPRTVISMLRRVAQSLAITSTVRTAASMLRRYSQSLTVTATARTITAMVRRTAETLVLTDSVKRASAMLRRVAESLSVLATASKRFTRRATETLYLTSTVQTTFALVQKLIQGLAVTSAVRFAFRKAIAQNLTVASTLAKRFSRAVREALYVTERLTKTARRKVTESLKVSDTVAKYKAQLLSIIQGLAVSATIRMRQWFVRRYTQGLSIADRLNLTGRLSKYLSEALNISANVRTIETLIRRYVQGITLTATGARNLRKLLYQGSVLAETVSVVRALSAKLQEALAVSATVAKRIRIRLSQALASSEQISKRFNLFIRGGLALRTRAFPGDRVYYANMETLRDFELRNMDDDTYTWLHGGIIEHATNFMPNIVKDGRDFYIAYQGPNLDMYAIQLKDGVWSEPVYVGPTLVPGDGHGAPTMTMRSDGYLVVMGGCHDSDVKYYYVSPNAKSVVGTWTRNDSPTSPNEMTYPFLSVNPGTGDLYLIYRRTQSTNYDWRVVKNWSTLTSYIGPLYWWDALYTSDSCPRWKQLPSGHWTLWFSGTWYDATWGGRRNVYVFYFDTFDNHWYNVAGTDFGTVLSQSEIQTDCVAYQHSTDYTYLALIGFRSDGNPLIVTTRAGDGGIYEYISSYWNGSSWTTPVVIASTGGTEWQWVIGALLQEGNHLVMLTWNTDKRIRAYEYDESTDSWSLQKTLLVPSQSHYGVGWDNYGPRASVHSAIIPEDDTTTPFNFAIATIEDTGIVNILEAPGPTDGIISSIGSATGVLGRAYQWSGAVGEKVQVSHHTDLRWTDGGPVSVSLWIYPTNTSLGRIIQKSNTTSNGWYVDASPSGDIVDVTLYWYGSGASPGSLTISNVPKSQWNHIVFTIGNSYARGYLNTDKVAEVSASGAYLNTDALFIGEASDGTKTWNGRIDELAIYRKELSQNDVLRLYIGQSRLRSLLQDLSVGATIVKGVLKRLVSDLTIQALIKLPGRIVLTQALAVSAAVVKHTSKGLRQSLALLDSTFRQFARRLSEGLSASSSLSKHPVKKLAPGTVYDAWNGAIWASSGDTEISYGKIGRQNWDNKAQGPIADPELCILGVNAGNTDGRYERATKFDGVNYGSISYDPKYEVNYVTLMAWVRPDVAGQTTGIVAQYIKSGSDWYTSWGLGLSNGKPYFIVNEWAGDGGHGPTWPTAISTDEWHLLVGTFDGSKVRLYVDDQSPAEVSYISSLNTLTANIKVGKIKDSAVYQGAIDDLVIAGRAWSAEQVLNVYQSPLGMNIENYGAQVGVPIEDFFKRIHNAIRRFEETLALTDSLLSKLYFLIRAVTTLGTYTRPSREASLSLMVIREATGQPVSGATVTGVISRPDGSVYRSLTLTEDETVEGLYKATFRIYATDALGVYPVSITAVAGEHYATYQGFLQIYQGPISTIHFG